MNASVQFLKNVPQLQGGFRPAGTTATVELTPEVEALSADNQLHIISRTESEEAVAPVSEAKPNLGQVQDPFHSPVLDSLLTPLATTAPVTVPTTTAELTLPLDKKRAK